jgi:anti-sigma factor RsiW
MTPISQSTEHLDPNRLSAFIDRELSLTEQQGIEQHLTNCHVCALRALSATQLKTATARAGQRFAPPPEALARLTAHLHSEQNKLEQKKTPAPMHSVRPLIWTALAAALLLAVSLFGWRQFHPTDTLVTELLDQHLATLSTAAVPQVISTDRHTVKPWFQGRLPFSFNLPEATALPADTTLKGADLAFLNGQPAALLLFTIHKHEVSVFLTQRSTSPTSGILKDTRAGFTIHTATTPDLRIIAVSDVNPTDLDSLLAVLVQAQKTA